MQKEFGILASILALIASLLYIIAILRGKTKPNRATWWVLAIAGTMLALSYHSVGAGATLYLAVSYVVAFFLIAIFSLKYGEKYPDNKEGRYQKWIDRMCLAGAVISFPIWYFQSAELALFINIFVDFMGLWLTIKKAYLRPETEDKTAWTIGLIASIVNIFAIEQWNLDVASYPVYLAVTNCFIVYFLYRPKPKQSNLKQ